MSLLCINVRRARLMGPDVQFSTYVTLKLQNVKSTTITVKGSDPMWEQDFLFETSRMDTGLVLEIWNKGLLWDKLMGCSWLPLGSIHFATEGNEGQWLSLDAELVIKDGDVCGTQTPTGHMIYVEAHFEPPFEYTIEDVAEFNRKLDVYNNSYEDGQDIGNEEVNLYTTVVSGTWQETAQDSGRASPLYHQLEPTSPLLEVRSMNQHSLPHPPSVVASQQRQLPVARRKQPAIPRKRSLEPLSKFDHEEHPHHQHQRHNQIQHHQYHQLPETPHKQHHNHQPPSQPQAQSVQSRQLPPMQLPRHVFRESPSHKTYASSSSNVLRDSHHSQPHQQQHPQQQHQPHHHSNHARDQLKMSHQQDSYESYTTSLGTEPETYEECMSDIADLAKQLGDYGDFYPEEETKDQIAESKWIFDSDKGWVPNPASSSPVPAGAVKSSTLGNQPSSFGSQTMAASHPAKGLGAKISAALGGDVVTVIGNQTGNEPLDNGSAPPPPPAPEFPVPGSIKQRLPASSQPSATKSGLKRSSPVTGVGRGGANRVYPAGQQPGGRQGSPGSRQLPTQSQKKKEQWKNSSMSRSTIWQTVDAMDEDYEEEEQLFEESPEATEPRHRPAMQANKSFSQQPASLPGGRSLPKIPPSSAVHSSLATTLTTTPATGFGQQQHNQQHQPPQPAFVPKQQQPQQPFGAPPSALKLDGKRDSEPAKSARQVTFSDQQQQQNVRANNANNSNLTTLNGSDHLTMMSGQAHHQQASLSVTSTSMPGSTMSHGSSSVAKRPDLDAQHQQLMSNNSSSIASSTLPSITSTGLGSSATTTSTQVLPSVITSASIQDSTVATARPGDNVTSAMSMPATIVPTSKAFEQPQQQQQQQQQQQLQRQHDLLPGEPALDEMMVDEERELAVLNNDGQLAKRTSLEHGLEQETQQETQQRPTREGELPEAPQDTKKAKTTSAAGGALEPYAPSEVDGLSVARIRWMSAFNKIIAQWNEVSGHDEPFLGSSIFGLRSSSRVPSACTFRAYLCFHWQSRYLKLDGLSAMSRPCKSGAHWFYCHSAPRW